PPLLVANGADGHGNTTVVGGRSCTGCERLVNGRNIRTFTVDVTKAEDVQD
ncbi:unnamed protein product, partial [Ectocarpus sp. 13 AM-2016]